MPEPRRLVRGQGAGVGRVVGAWCGEPTRGAQRFCEGTREVSKGTRGLA